MKLYVPVLRNFSSRIYFPSLLIAATIMLLGTQSAGSTPCRATEDPAWELMPTGTNASLRGLFVLDENVVWASGTNGTLVSSSDQGRTWRLQVIPGAEALDIRDLHVFDAKNILAMTSGTPARLYRSADAGLSWRMVFESNDPQVFLDSVSFLDPANGLVMGDPVDGRLFLLHSQDAGWTWTLVPDAPELEPGEAGFAASGTNMTTIGGTRWAIALGGGLRQTDTARNNASDASEERSNSNSNSDSDSDSSAERTGERRGQAQTPVSRIVTVDRDLREWQISDTPIKRHESAGIFSLVFVDSLTGIAVGGDYKQPELAAEHLAVTQDGGATWSVPKAGPTPSGFRSCVAVGRRGTGQPSLIAVGTHGTDLSWDLGQTWQRVSDLGFNAVQFSENGQVGWAAGSNGRVARWRTPSEPESK